MKTGDLVRWDVDVDKVYSEYTKRVVGTVGTILPPQEYLDSKGEKYLTPEGLRDVEFYLETRMYTVGNIPESELTLVLSVNE